jgi:hypothetical protein
MAASSGFDGECFHCGEYGPRASAHSDESSRHFTKSQRGIGERRRGPRRHNDRQGYRQDRARPGCASKGSDQNARYQSLEKGDYQERAASAIAAAHNIRNWVAPTSVVVDSGATGHMMCDISMFEHVMKIDPIRVMLGDNSSVMCSKGGTVGRNVSIVGNSYLHSPIDVISVAMTAGGVIVIHRQAVDVAIKLGFAAVGKTSLGAVQ